VSGESARLFVALELPGPIRAALAEWADRQHRALSALRVIDAAALHVTLCFLGSRPVAEIDRIASECSVAADEAEIPLALGEPLWLPRRRPRALAVALEDSADRLAGVQSRLAEALEAAGFYESERRPFLGHVTVGRVGRGARIRPIDLSAPAPERFSAATVTLFRSRTGRAGARYEPLASVELRRYDGS
jgi:2'-5' RNA ligase